MQRDSGTAGPRPGPCPCPCRQRSARPSARPARPAGLSRAAQTRRHSPHGPAALKRLGLTAPAPPGSAGTTGRKARRKPAPSRSGTLSGRLAAPQAQTGQPGRKPAGHRNTTTPDPHTPLLRGDLAAAGPDRPISSRPPAPPHSQPARQPRPTHENPGKRNKAPFHPGRGQIDINTPPPSDSKPHHRRKNGGTGQAPARNLPAGNEAPP